VGPARASSEPLLHHKRRFAYFPELAKVVQIRPLAGILGKDPVFQSLIKAFGGGISLGD
jgi:hypothetical protein